MGLKPVWSLIFTFTPPDLTKFNNLLYRCILFNAFFFQTKNCRKISSSAVISEKGQKYWQKTNLEMNFSLTIFFLLLICNHIFHCNMLITSSNAVILVFSESQKTALKEECLYFSFLPYKTMNSQFISSWSQSSNFHNFLLDFQNYTEIWLRVSHLYNFSMQLQKGFGLIEQNCLPNRNASWVVFFLFDLPNELQLLFALFIRLSQDKGWPLNWINKAKVVGPCLKGR
jgi:hypothetical protein